MMKDRSKSHDPSLRRALACWLSLERQAREPGAEADREAGAEAAAAEAAAEQALLALFVRLPLWAPSPGFAERVMAMLYPAPAGGRLFRHWGVRAAVALCLVQTGLLLGAGVATIWALGRTFGLGELVVRATHAGVFLLELVASAMKLGSVLVGVARAGAAAAASPQVLLVAALCAAVAATALYPLLRGSQHDGGAEHA